MSSPATQQPSPQLFFQTINAYQRTEALKAAIELEVFTAIGEGNGTAAEIAKRCNASERGTRILCDFLCIMGFLNKEGNRYSLTQDSAIFLDKRSPAYMGGITEFISTPELTDAFKDFAGVVRKGGTTMSEDGTVSAENPIWVKFALRLTGRPCWKLPKKTRGRRVLRTGIQLLPAALSMWITEQVTTSCC